MADTPKPSKGKAITIEAVKFFLYAATVIAAMIVFVFTSQASQDKQINQNCSAIDKNETRHQEHVRHSTETFRNLDSTMKAQQQVMTQTREVLIRLDESNKRLTDEVKELSRKVSP